MLLRKSGNNGDKQQKQITIGTTNVGQFQIEPQTVIIYVINAKSMNHVILFAIGYWLWAHRIL